jgi:hypothetical protein
VIVLVVAVLTAVAACTSSPETDAGSSTVSFASELQEAEQMVAKASTLAAAPAAPVHTNVDGGSALGAPDPDQERRNIEVRWVQAGPPPFAAIRDLWTTDFGYTVTSESADDVFLAKGDMRASISQGMAAADGNRNVWFGVLTGTHPAAEVPDPS